VRGGGGGFSKRRGGTTSSDADGGPGSAGFVPGSDGNLMWNTTQPIGDRPILLYVFDGHVAEGSSFEYAKSVELAIFGSKENKELLKEARGFVCEKICNSAHEFLRQVKGREPVSGFLAANMEKSDQRKVQVLFLDARGKLISTFTDPKAIKEGGAAFLREMKRAREENARRLLAEPPPPKQA
jgi:hypothetical protein